MTMVVIFWLVFVIVFLCSASEAWGQTTEFTYRGSLKDGSNSANGNYDFEFLLFNSLTGGVQL